MKSVHKALRLHHHKHTGKLLAHHHTSYRVLFLLLLAPIAMMALVGHLQAKAADYTVTAIVPAPIPAEGPTVTSPADGSTIETEQTVVSGICPVITPSVIIAIYADDVFIGSATCRPDGTYTVPVTLPIGPHTLVATVTTITGGVGASSQPRVIIRAQPNNSTASGVTDAAQMTLVNNSLLVPFVHISQVGTFVFISANGNAVWQGSFTSGVPPYKIKIDWGDQSIDEFTVPDHTQQSFSHTYKSPGTYRIVVTVVDVNGAKTTLYSTATSLLANNGVGVLDSPAAPINSVLGFIDRYLLQIYVLTLSSVVFLWYIEHGRHIAGAARRVRHR